MATLILHNYLRQSVSTNIYCPPGLTDGVLPTGEFTPGYWRNEEEPSFFDLSPVQYLGNANANAKEVRNTSID